MQTLSFWADVSTVYIMSGVFIFSIIPLVGLYFAVRGMQIVNRKLPNYLKLGQYYSGIMRTQVDRGSDAITGVVARTYGQANRAEGIVRGLDPRRSAASPHSQEKKP